MPQPDQHQTVRMRLVNWWVMVWQMFNKWNAEVSSVSKKRSKSQTLMPLVVKTSVVFLQQYHIPSYISYVYLTVWDQYQTMSIGKLKRLLSQSGWCWKHKKKWQKKWPLRPDSPHQRILKHADMPVTLANKYLHLQLLIVFTTTEILACRPTIVFSH